MPLLEIDLGKLTDWLLVAIALAALVSGIFAALFAKKNIRAVIEQLRSQSNHQIYEAHKTLYFPIVQSRELSDIVSGGDGGAFQINMLGSMLINHSARLFAEVRAGNLPMIPAEVFRADLVDFLSWPAVYNRWPEVKSFHDPEFVALVEECRCDPKLLELIAQRATAPISGSPAPTPMQAAHASTVHKGRHRQHAEV